MTSDPELPDARQFPATGHPRVDEALQRLDGLPDRPVTEHAAEFEAVHQTLRNVLDGADTPDE